jgi:hypothetical protein
MVFLQNSLRSLAGNFRAEFDPEQGIRIPEQGIWRPPGNPNPGEMWGAEWGQATRIYAPISITNPPASLAPPFGFLAKDAEFSLQSPQSP